MRNIAPIKQKILQYLKHQGVTRYEFYKKSGIGKGILDKNTGLTEDNIKKFLEFAPDVSAEWLLGRGGPRSIEDIKEHYFTLFRTESKIEEPELEYRAVGRENHDTGREAETLTVKLELGNFKELNEKVNQLEKRLIKLENERSTNK